MITQVPTRDNAAESVLIYRIHCPTWPIAPLRAGSLTELALPKIPTIVTEREMDAWWKNQPEANPALIVPERLVVADVDGELRDDPLFDGYMGPEMRRLGGYYLFFRVDRPVLTGQIKPGLRVLGWKGVVPLPPTDGHTWLTAPWEADIPEAPAWLMEEMERIRQEREDHREDNRRETQADILLRIAQSAELFHTRAGDCYAVVPVDVHKECWPIRSKGFKKWLCWQYFLETERKAPNTEALQNALNVIEAQATFDGPEVEVYTRIAEADGKIYLDLCNDEWEVVEISESGWRVLGESPVRFRRADGMAPLPRPVEGGSLEDLRRFVNAPDDRTWILLVSWLIGCFHPRGPYPVLVLQGEHGSGKTTTLRVLRELVDPNLSATRTIPKEERDLAVAAKNAWVVAFDNLSGIPTWLSDALCRLSTGSGLSTRKLYTDDEEALFYARRPIAVNGIDDIVSRNDLLDRALIVNLPPIPEPNRKREDVFWREFEEARPRLLGALCDAIQVALANRNLVTFSELPRMADFAAWVVAAEPGLPWRQGEFMREYAGMRAEAISLALESDPVAQAVIALAENGPWEGTATELLARIEADGLVSEKLARSESWPKSPKAIANRLRRAATFLRQAGVEVEFARVGKDRTRLIRIALADPTGPENAVCGVRQALFSEVDSEADANVSSANRISSAYRPPQNRSVKREADDADDADGDFLYSLGPTVPDLLR